jgi:3-hydroxy-9,10-secoandrosta-1,3,5(10)-triene-9,17-dione monooxygenase reductase component
VSEVDSAEFRRVLGHFPTGVTVVTAAAEPPVGVSVAQFFSVSLDPLLVGFCAIRSSSTWPSIRATGSFCVNVLAEDQEVLSRRFSQSGVDRFEGVAWTPGPGGPRLGGALAWVDADIRDVHEAGDHDICVGEVTALGVEHEAGPLVWFRSGYGRFAV